jgi:uncharacterized repeat protein (TIGR01451 family)
MISALPPFLRLTDTVGYTNALVTAYPAVDTRTADTPALVLQAPAATAICLERARAALQRLGAMEWRPVGLPAVIEWREAEDGGAWLALGEVQGQPLQQRLLDLKPLAEKALLAVVWREAQLLAALHRSGYSGLRPSAHEIFWSDDMAPPWFTVIGWEWLIEGTDDAAGDLRAAAALWIELAGGVPPAADLAIERGTQPWQALSIGTRQLVFDLWRDCGPNTADALTGALADLQRRWETDPTALLAEGQNMLKSDPVQALALIDIARRANPPPAGADQVYAIARSAQGGYADVLIEQGRRDLTLGQYQAALRTFTRAGRLWVAMPQHRLAARRWQTAALALHQVVDVAAGEVSARALEPQLVRVMDLAEAGEIDLARETLEGLLENLPAGVSLPTLTDLQIELRAQQLWQRAAEARQAGDWARFGDLSASLAGETAHLSYRETFAEALGDPEAMLRQARIELERWAQGERLLEEARRALADGETAPAATLARQAAGRWRNDPERVEVCLRLAWQADLRGAAVIAGAGREPASVVEPAERMRAVSALTQLLRAFPDDTWAREKAEVWRRGLLNCLDSQPTSSDGALLQELWPADVEVQATLARAAPLAMSQWQQDLDTCQREAAMGRPQDLESAANTAKVLEWAINGARAWLAAAGEGATATRLLEVAGRVRSEIEEKQVRQAAWRDQYEQALTLGQPVDGLLARAAEAGLQFYNEPGRSVRRLQAHSAGWGGRAAQPLWQHGLRLAESAWQQGDRETAQTAFELVQADSAAPAHAHRYAALAQTALADGLNWQPLQAEAQWEGRAQTLLAALAATLDRQAIPPGTSSVDTTRKTPAKPEPLTRRDGWRIGFSIWIQRHRKATVAAISLSLVGILALVLSTRAGSIHWWAEPETQNGLPTEAPTLTLAPDETVVPATLTSVAPSMQPVGTIQLDDENITVPADGQTTFELMASVYDVDTVPAARRLVTFALARSSSQDVIQEDVVVAASGKAVWVLPPSSEPGEGTVTVSADGVTTVAYVTYVSAPPSAYSSQPQLSGTLRALRDGAEVADVAPGDEITFVFTIRNDGPNPVDGVNVICDPVAATQYATGTLTPAEGGGANREVLRTIAANSAQQASLTLKVDDNAPSDSTLALQCRLEIPGLS